jgi:hypothetical protein
VKGERKMAEPDEKTRQEQALEHYEKGRDFEDHGQKKEAYDEYQAAIIKDPDNYQKYKDALERMEKS